MSNKLIQLTFQISISTDCEDHTRQGTRTSIIRLYINDTAECPTCLTSKLRHLHQRLGAQRTSVAACQAHSEVCPQGSCPVPSPQPPFLVSLSWRHRRHCMHRSELGRRMRPSWGTRDLRTQNPFLDPRGPAASCCGNCCPATAPGFATGQEAMAQCRSLCPTKH